MGQEEPTGVRAPVPAMARDAMWVEKYRPKTLDDVAAHKDIVGTIKKLLAAGRLPHLLFYGPPGTGKTSTVLAIANEVYGASRPHMVLELNASDERGIDVVRQQVQDFASSRFMAIGSAGAPACPFKLVVLDECDAMTKDAQAALRRVIERYSRSTRFCLICNYVSRVIPALQSRCTRFRFKPLDAGFVRTRLSFVAQQEDVSVDEGGLDALVALGAGDMRRTLNIMQSSYMSDGDITEAAVYACTGSPTPGDIERAAGWLLNEQLQAAFQRITELQVSRGYALADLLAGLHGYVMRIHMPTRVRADLLSSMALIEHALSAGASERLQLGALAGAFSNTRAGIVAAAQ